MPLALTDLLSPDVPVQGELRVRLPLADLGRLDDMLLDPPGQVDVTLQIQHHGDGVLLVEGAMGGMVRVACQRCLEPLQVAVARDIRVALVEVSSAVPVPAGFESLTLEDGPLSIQALLEDELLLALPLAPVHTDMDDCGDLASRLETMATEDAGAPRDHPFAVLERLKR